MTVFITGASGGLGRVMAVECAKRGYNLFLTDVDVKRLDALKNGIVRRYGVQVQTHACDLTDSADIDHMFGYIDAQNIRFDMLLNIAGIDYEGSFLERECSKIRDIVRLNIEATLTITHGILDRRAQGGAFYLVFVSSLASIYPIPLKATYAASKRFLLDFATALGQELKHKKTHVMALCPGGLVTTQEAINGILAQGIWGEATTNRMELVAHRTIARVLNGRRTYFPGVLDRLFSLIGPVLPRTLIAKLLYNRWNKAQKHWLTQ